MKLPHLTYPNEMGILPFPHIHPFSTPLGPALFSFVSIYTLSGQKEALGELHRLHGNGVSSSSRLSSNPCRQLLRLEDVVRLVSPRKCANPFPVRWVIS